jgi:exonuclease SbcC
MPIRIRARNFQSIEDAEIVVDRFTVVTGPNNSGKTALQRAVQGVFTNPSGDAFVRHGAEKLVVDIDFGNDETVSWEKGPKVKPKYTIKGKAIHPGRQVPEEVLTLGVQPIQAGAVSVWPQVAPQFTGQVFLLDLPGSAIAEAVADVERVGKLTQALRLAESDKRAASAELKVRKKDVEAVEASLGEYAGLDAVAVVVEAVEQLQKDAEGVRASLSVAESVRTRINTSATERDALQGVRDIHVPSEEALNQAASTGRTVKQIEALRARLTQAQASSQTFAGVRNIRISSIPLEVQQARDALRAVEALAPRVRAMASTGTRLKSLRKALASVDAGEIQRKLEGATRAQKALAHFEGLLSKLATARAEITTLSATLTSKKQSLGETEAEIREVLGGLGSCPVCQTPMASSHAH